MKRFSLNLDLERNKTIDIELQNNEVISKTSYYPFADYFYNRRTLVRIKIDNNSEEKLEEIEKYLRSKGIDYEIMFEQIIRKN